jgi:hypothetical protein
MGAAKDLLAAAGLHVHVERLSEHYLQTEAGACFRKSQDDWAIRPSIRDHCTCGV